MKSIYISNTGYLLLAEVVKRVSGHSLREFADEHIFNPLGMKNTHFHDDFTEIVKERAMGYSPNDQGGYRLDMSIIDVVGDGCIYTNVEDLFIWDKNFYNNILGGYGQDLIEMVTTVGTLNSGELLDYAFGLFVEEYKGLRTVHHGGSWMGYGAELIRFPEQGFSVICLSNSSSINSSRLAKQVADLYLSDLFIELDNDSEPRETEIIKLSARDFESKIGIYFCTKTGSVCELSMKDGKLISGVFDLNFQIVPTSLNQFKAINIPYDINFTFGNSGSDKGNNVQIQFEEGTIYTYTRMKTEVLNPDQMQEFVGDYYCEELNTNYKIIFNDDTLQFSKKYSPPKTLKFIANDLFFWSYITFRFSRDAKYQVIGFSLGAGRVKNLKFIKRNLEP